MRIRLRFDFPRRVLLAIAHKLGLRRPAHRDEVVDFVEGAVESEVDKAVDEMIAFMDREDEGRR